MRQCSEKSKYRDNQNYICNPASGRYVKKDGLTGMKLTNNMTIYVESLENNGYAVIPVDRMDTDMRKRIRKEMMDTMKEFPEYIHSKIKNNKYVMGGFSALGNPASFHNEFVRKMRMLAMSEMVPLFKEYIKQLDGGGWKLEQLIGRLLFRIKGVSATAESWHRDEAALAHKSDKTFGGWWNFDDYDQFFSCVPGTHKGIRGHSGFAPIKNKEEKKQYNKDKIKLRIPPGHIMIFYEHLVHEVLAKKSKENMHRLFLGWRVTKSKDSLYPIDVKLKNQAVIPLKSNQVPPMYATLHWTNWRHRIVEFSEAFRPECIESRRVKNGKDEGKSYDVVHRHMLSLKDYGFKLYPEYSKEEISMHKPNTKWKLSKKIKMWKK
jgi:hypothetical protein